MQGMGLKLTPCSGSEKPLRLSQHVWAYSWHFLDSHVQLQFSPNNPKKEFNPPPAATHSSSALPTPPPPTCPPHPLPPAHPLIYACPCDITVVVKKGAQNPAVLTEIVIKCYIAKRLFQLYSISDTATIQHKKITVVSIFEIGISQNTKQTIWLVSKIRIQLIVLLYVVCYN